MASRILFILCLLCFAGRADADCPDLEPDWGPGQAAVLRYESFRILGTMVIDSAGTDGRAWLYPGLPGGGIGRVDLCGLARVVPFANGRSIASMPDNGSRRRSLVMGLVLRSGVDYRSAYPAAYKEIRRRNQFIEFPGGTMWVGKFHEGLLPDAGSETLNRLISEHSRCSTHSLIMTGDTVLIPTC